MGNFARTRNFLGTRIAHAHGVIKLPANRDIDRLVDRGGKHGTAMTAVIGRQIRTTAKKTDAQWSARNDHVMCALLLATSKSSAARLRSGTTWSALYSKRPSRSAA